MPGTSGRDTCKTTKSQVHTNLSACPAQAPKTEEKLKDLFLILDRRNLQLGRKAREETPGAFYPQARSEGQITNHEMEILA